MAKEKFITRTITTITVEVMLINTNSEQVSKVELQLPTYCTTEKLAMAELSQLYKSVPVVPVKITKLHKEDKLFRMSEDMFIAYGEEISHR